MPRSTLVAGNVLAQRFRIIGCLGVGGFGAVYEAERVEDARRVALKVLHTAVAADPVERKRFRREASVMAELRHPHIAQVVEAGETDDGAPYLALELLRGRSLRDELKGAGPRSAAWVAHVARQVLLALTAAHERGTVHRDLKPHNLFLCADQGAEPFIKVLDFGIAKLVGAGANVHTQLTATGTFLGTPRYMAPEQIRGGELGASLDLYALGLIMAEALAGRPVVRGADEMAVLLAQANDAPHALPDAVVQSPLGPVVVRAVQKQVADRYLSAAAMLADLEAAAAPAPQPVAPSPTAAPVPAVGPGPYVQGFHGRPAQSGNLRRVAIAVGAAALLAVGGAGAVVWAVATGKLSVAAAGGNGTGAVVSTLTREKLERRLRQRKWVPGDVSRYTMRGTYGSAQTTHQSAVRGDATCFFSLTVYESVAAADVAIEEAPSILPEGTAYVRGGDRVLGAYCTNADTARAIDEVLRPPR